MARIRTIKPEFPQSESMGRVSREARLCFVLLWTVADDSGRLRGNSRMLASLLYPYDDDAKDHIGGWLEELERERCITRYAVDGDAYIEVRNWLTHQKIDRPTASKIPPYSRKLASPREDSSGDLDLDLDLDQGREGSGRAREDFETVIQTTYPAGPQVQPSSWGLGLRHACRLVEQGVATEAELLDAVGRYRASIDSRVAVEGERARQFVKSPARFFDPTNNPPIWRDEFPIAVTRAQAAQDDNVAAGIAWLNGAA